jgi:NADH dehydrogenase/NADH:ubiquinone oxidoreductase subunit G
MASPHASLEELFLLRELARSSAGGAICSGPTEADQAAGDDILLSADRTPNRAGLKILGIEELATAELAGRIQAAQGVILIAGGDLALQPELASALEGKEAVYLGTHNNATAALAKLVLPGAMWAEKAGTFVNRQNRLQTFKQAVVRPGTAREDWRILTEAMGNPEEYGSLRAIRLALSDSLGLPEGITLNNLPALGFVYGTNTEGEV